MYGTPMNDRIRERAYELYEARGSIDGLALDDWLQAETELAPRDEIVGSGDTTATSAEVTQTEEERRHLE